LATRKNWRILLKKSVAFLKRVRLKHSGFWLLTSCFYIPHGISKSKPLPWLPGHPARHSTFGVESRTQVVVQGGPSVSIPEPVSISAAQPAIFTRDGLGSGQGMVYRIAEGGSMALADASSPAQAGDESLIYCAGNHLSLREFALRIRHCHAPSEKSS